jgi:hypothetical protein
MYIKYPIRTGMHRPMHMPMPMPIPQPMNMPMPIPMNMPIPMPMPMPMPITDPYKMMFTLPSLVKTQFNHLNVKITLFGDPNRMRHLQHYIMQCNVYETMTTLNTILTNTSVEGVNILLEGNQTSVKNILNHLLNYEPLKSDCRNVYDSSTNKTYMGSGIMLFCFNKSINTKIDINDISIIMGIDKDGDYQDFGGKIDFTRLNVSDKLLHNAKKELTEETNTLFNIEKNTKPNYFIDVQHNRTYYRCYFYFIYIEKYDNLINDFKNNFEKNNNKPDTYNEIIKIEIIPLNSAKSYKLRKRTAAILENITNDYKSIFSKKIIPTQFIENNMITYKL